MSFDPLPHVTSDWKQSLARAQLFEELGVWLWSYFRFLLDVHWN